MSTEQRIQRFKSCYTAVSIITIGATATATNMVQQAVYYPALRSAFNRSSLYLLDNVLVQLQAVPFLYR